MCVCVYSTFLYVNDQSYIFIWDLIVYCVIICCQYCILFYDFVLLLLIHTVRIMFYVYSELFKRIYYFVKAIVIILHQNSIPLGTDYIAFLFQQYNQQH